MLSLLGPGFDPWSLGNLDPTRPMVQEKKKKTRGKNELCPKNLKT